MSDQTCRKTDKETLRPTPTQERERERVLWCCRTLYNAALQQRITAWTRCHVSLTRSQQEAELKAIREAMPEYAAIPSHVRHDVLARLDTTYQAFFRRVQAGAGGCRRVQAGAGGCRRASGRGARASGGASAPTRSPTRRTATAPGWRTAVWCCRRSDASPWGGPGRCSRPVQGSIKTVTVAREADGWYICCSCAEGPTQPLALTGRETGIDVGLKVLLITAEGQSVANPRHYRTAERALKTAQQRVSRRTKGSHRRRKAVRGVARTH
jgi:putative transposase